MSPSTVHLPNGQTLTCTAVFGGLQFKANELNTHHNAFPAGWTIVIHSEDAEEDHHPPLPSQTAHSLTPSQAASPAAGTPMERKRHIHRFRKPTLRSDHLFISSISNPSSSDFRPASSPTRQIAMMLWATLWWYFHQPSPDPHLTTAASANTPEEGRPKGEWVVHINREGIFRAKHLLPKLSRMGLLASADSTVGVDPADGVTNAGEGWLHMFVSQRTFWQLDARIYLFTLTPNQVNSPYPSVSPATSRPSSPSRHPPPGSTDTTSGALHAASSSLARSSTPPGPFSSGSHLPTFYPPAPAHYTFTNGIRHPIRPKPPRQGETFYARWVPSVGQYLSFRVASLSKHPVPYRGPLSGPAPDAGISPGTRESLRAGAVPASDSVVPIVSGFASLADAKGGGETECARMSDCEILHRWMNDERVAYSWGEKGPLSHQEAFLKAGLTSKHSFPVIGCWDGKPFGYFELYWVKEDKLSGLTGGNVGDWDRGIHCLVGEQEFRGRHRVKIWLSALVHYCWLADLRTERVLMEPRVDNEKLRRYCEAVGFFKEREVTFPHKQSNLMVIKRDAWVAPEL